MARLLTDLLLLLLLLLLAGCSLARGADLPAALHDGSHVLWGPALVDAAVLRVGAPSLAPLLAKLGRGEPVTVLAFGSSVVQYSFGSWWSSAKALHDTGVLAFSRASQIEPNNPGDVCEPQDGGGACRMGGVGTALMRHLNATWPHPGHALVNVGQPGGGLQSVLESLCVDALLPHTADLLLFEVSGGGPGGGTSPGDATVYPFYASALYHQMLHTLDRPAGLPVVLVHAPYVWELNGECEAYEASNFTFASLFEKSDQIDDTASAVAAYYGFSQLSLRNALWDALRAGAPAALGLSDCLYVKAYLRDRIHPTIAGAEFLGEALVRLFDVAAERLRGRAGVTPDGRLSVAEEAMAAPAATGSGRLVPLFPAAASTGTRQRKCIESHQMLLLQNSGWEFKWRENVTDPTTHEVHEVEKPGVVALMPGAAFTLRVNTRIRQRPKDERVEVHVTYLTSYEHMGRGAVRCESGCECEGAALEGHSVAHASQEGVAVLHVTQALLCHLRFEVEDATLSGDHKVKLLGITVEPGK